MMGKGGYLVTTSVASCFECGDSGASLAELVLRVEATCGGWSSWAARRA